MEAIDVPMQITLGQRIDSRYEAMKALARITIAVVIAYSFLFGGAAKAQQTLLNPECCQDYMSAMPALVPMASLVATIGMRAIMTNGTGNPQQGLRPEELRAARLHQAIAQGIPEECRDRILAALTEADRRQISLWASGSVLSSGQEGLSSDRAILGQVRTFNSNQLNLFNYLALAFPSGCVDATDFRNGAVWGASPSPLARALQINAGSAAPNSAADTVRDIGGSSYENQASLSTSDANAINLSYAECQQRRDMTGRYLRLLVENTPEQLRSRVQEILNRRSEGRVRTYYERHPMSPLDAERSLIFERDAARGEEINRASIINSAAWQTIRTFYQFVLQNYQSQEELEQSASRLRSLPVADRIMMTSLLGDSLAGYYNHDRVGVALTSNSPAGGSVSFLQLITNLRLNLESGTSNDAGVCRDIARAQAQFLQYMGFPDTFIVSSGSNSQIMHTTTLTRDPENRDRIYHFNYGLLNSGSARGLPDPTMALATPGGRDFTHTVYRIFDANGHPVTSEQGPQAVTLAAMAGLDRNSPLAAAPQSLLRINSPTMGASTHVAASMAQDYLGNSYFGLGISRVSGNPDRNSSQYGAMLALQRRTEAAFNPSTFTIGQENVEAGILYAYFQRNWNTRQFELIQDSLRFRIEAYARMIYSMFVTMERDPDAGGGIDLRAGAQARISQGDWRSRFSSEYIVGAQGEPMILDATNTQLGQAPIPFLTHLLFSAEGRLRLSQSQAGRAYLIAATTALVDMLGIRGRAQLGLAVGNVAATAQIQGPLTQGAQPWQSGGSTRAGVGLQVLFPTFGTRLGITGDLPLADPDAGLQVSGNLSIDLDGRRVIQLPRIQGSTTLPQNRGQSPHPRTPARH